MEHKPIGKVLSMTYRAHQALVDEGLRELNTGVGSGQLFLLLALYRKEGICQHELAEQYRLDKAAVARAVKKLEALEMVRKEPSPEDHRKSRILLTDKAREYRKPFYEIVRAIDERIRTYLSTEEIDHFIHTAEILHGGIVNEIDKERSHAPG